ncbi:MAG: PilN domain-containing protein [Sulfuritalea sp.]|nr:PilN domain-containing protein [Sulfuritalea sp.]MDP1984601.1 PilN domain-containing protein [Sulfuritalea sp.]
MSAQLNLYSPRYLKQRDPFGLGSVLVATLGFYLLLVVIASWASYDASRREVLAAATDAQLNAVKAEVAAAMQTAAAHKPNSQLQAEVENAEALLRRRENILRLLETGAIGTTSGFAEYFRALARQAPEGLWLTGFSVATGGDIRIEGSTLQAAAVPDYIGRLAREKAFQGKSFAALTMQRPAAVAAPVAAIPAAASAAQPGVGDLRAALAAMSPLATPSAPAPTQSAATRSAPNQANARYIDFVLLPKAASANAEVKR